MEDNYRKKLDNSEWKHKLGRESQEDIVKKSEEFNKGRIDNEELEQYPEHMKSRVKLRERLEIDEKMFIKSGDLIPKVLTDSRGDKYVSGNKTSLAATFSNGIQKSKARGNRKITPDEMKWSAMEYFMKIDLTDQKPNLNGLCVNMGISVRTFKRYMECGVQEYEEAAELIEGTLVSALAEGSHIKDILELKNQHGYKDKTENVVKVENVLDELSDEELDKKIETLTEVEEGVYE